MIKKYKEYNLLNKLTIIFTMSMFTSCSIVESITKCDSYVEDYEALGQEWVAELESKEKTYDKCNSVNEVREEIINLSCTITEDTWSGEQEIDPSDLLKAEQMVNAESCEQAHCYYQMSAFRTLRTDFVSKYSNGLEQAMCLVWEELDELVPSIEDPDMDCPTNYAHTDSDAGKIFECVASWKELFMGNDCSLGFVDSTGLPLSCN